MKTAFVLVLIVGAFGFWCYGQPSSRSLMRTWTFTENGIAAGNNGRFSYRIGGRVEAGFLRLEGTNTVALKVAFDGKDYRFPLASLSDADRRYVAQFTGESSKSRDERGGYLEEAAKVERIRMEERAAREARQRVIDAEAAARADLAVAVEAWQAAIRAMNQSTATPSGGDIVRWGVQRAMEDEVLGRKAWLAKQEVELKLRQLKMRADAVMKQEGEPGGQAGELSKRSNALGRSTTGLGFGSQVYDFHGAGALSGGTMDRFGDTRIYDFHGPAGRVQGSSDNLVGTEVFSFRGPGGTVKGASDSFGGDRFYNFLTPSGPGAGMSYSLGGFVFDDFWGGSSGGKWMNYTLGGVQFSDKLR